MLQFSTTASVLCLVLLVFCQLVDVQGESCSSYPQ